MSNPTPNPLSAHPPVLSRFHFLRAPASPSFRSKGGANRFVSKQWFLTERFQMSVSAAPGRIHSLFESSPPLVCDHKRALLSG